ncbi:MAG: hypothetical protein ABI589_01935 [Burkholderiales bacterium]
MGSWQKSPEELVFRFDQSLKATAGVERRKMFGCPSAFVHGNAFAFVHEHRLVVRLPDEAPGRPFPPGRPMREYAAFNGALDLEEAEFRELVARAFTYASGLPPKPAKPDKPRKKPPSAARKPAQKARPT